MNSFNHYAYGAVLDWIVGVASGISPVEESPAYREVEIKPHPGKELGFAESVLETRQGRIRSHWYYKGDVVYYEFDIPQGTTAKLRLPSGICKTLGEGCYHFAE